MQRKQHVNTWVALLSTTAVFLACSKGTKSTRSGFEDSSGTSQRFDTTSDQSVSEACIPSNVSGTNVKLAGDPCRPNDQGEGVEGYLTNQFQEISVTKKDGQFLFRAPPGTVAAAEGTSQDVERINIVILQTDAKQIALAVAPESTTKQLEAMVKGAATAQKDGSFAISMESARLNDDPLIIRVGGKIDSPIVPIKQDSASRLKSAFALGNEHIGSLFEALSRTNSGVPELQLSFTGGSGVNAVSYGKVSSSHVFSSNLLGLYNAYLTVSSQNTPTFFAQTLSHSMAVLNLSRGAFVATAIPSSSDSNPLAVSLDKNDNPVLIYNYQPASSPYGDAYTASMTNSVWSFPKVRIDFGNRDFGGGKGVSVNSAGTFMAMYTEPVGSYINVKYLTGTPDHYTDQGYVAPSDADCVANWQGPVSGGIDYQERFHSVFFCTNARGSGLYHAVFVDGSWLTKLVADDTTHYSSNGQPKIAFSKSGRIYIASVADDSKKIRLATIIGDTTLVEDVALASTLGFAKFSSVDLAVDADGAVHLLYGTRDAVGGATVPLQLIHSTNRSGIWQNTVLETSINPYSDVTLFVNGMRKRTPLP